MKKGFPQRPGHFDDFGRLVDLADFGTAYLDQDGPLLR